MPKLLNYVTIRKGKSQPALVFKSDFCQKGLRRWLQVLSRVKYLNNWKDVPPMFQREVSSTIENKYFLKLESGWVRRLSVTSNTALYASKIDISRSETSSYTSVTWKSAAAQKIDPTGQCLQMFSDGFMTSAFAGFSNFTILLYYC